MSRLASILESAYEFAIGLLKRWYLLLPAVLLDPVDLWNEFLRDWLLGPSNAKDFELPAPASRVAFIVLLACAAIATYHDLRVKHIRATSPVLRKVELVKARLRNVAETNKHRERVSEVVACLSPEIRTEWGKMTASMWEQDKMGTPRTKNDALDVERQWLLELAERLTMDDLDQVWRLEAS